MRSIRKGIDWIGKQALWRVSLLLLPWQIRWFHEGPHLNGFPWEQGRISIYTSWIPMICLILYVFFLYPQKEAADSKAISVRLRWLGMGGISLLLLSSLFTLSVRATIQWGIEWSILLGFFWSLSVLRISRTSLIAWFLSSLVPHLLLGLEQFQAHFIHGSKWLGMATQNPLDKGVSVVQVGDQRVLRAYGGFPHPNIFGGWLAIGMVLGISAWQEIKKYQRGLLSLFLVLSSIVLILTFSRAAWLACGLGMFSLFIILFFSNQRGDPSLSTNRMSRSRWSFMVPFVLTVVVLSLTLFLQRDLVFSRLQATATRLEVKSINERKIGIEHGIDIFKQYPFFGVGPGAELLAVSAHPVSESERLAPPLPPHVVPLMMLNELGMIGVTGFILMGLAFLSYTSVGRDREARARLLVLCMVFFPLLFLDHYLWSVWSGIAIFMIAVSTIKVRKT